MIHLRMREDRLYMQKDEPDFKTRVRAAVESKGLNVKQFARQAGMA